MFAVLNYINPGPKTYENSAIADIACYGISFIAQVLLNAILWDLGKKEEKPQRRINDIDDDEYEGLDTILEDQ